MRAYCPGLVTPDGVFPLFVSPNSAVRGPPPKAKQGIELPCSCFAVCGLRFGFAFAFAVSSCQPSPGVSVLASDTLLRVVARTRWVEQTKGGGGYGVRKLA